MQYKRTDSNKAYRSAMELAEKSGRPQYIVPVGRGFQVSESKPSTPSYVVALPEGDHCLKLCRLNPTTGEVVMHNAFLPAF